jgi:hypothetical protein
MLAPLVFDSPLLTSIVHAIERRGKAIRCQGTLACQRDLDRGVERLNVDVTSVLRERLRLSVWSDGAFWLGVNKPGPRREGGWQINEQVEGSLGEWTPLEIVGRIEESMLHPTDVARIWSPDASNQAMHRTAGRSGV